MALYAFDGTWNKPDLIEDQLDTNTNVSKFLDYYTCPETHKVYITGVGTRGRHVGAIVGGFTGAGGRIRVAEMTDAVRAQWANGDETVDVIGFSRGAATALDFCNRLAEGIEISGKTVKPTIRFLGLWDTVSAFGVPGIFISEAAKTDFGWKLEVPANVEHCAHAMALDEDRQAFGVHRLDPEADDKERITEVWFRGAHSDVGGGNTNVGRSNIALVWMLEQALAANLPIDPAKLAALRPLCDDFSQLLPSRNPVRHLGRLVLKGDTMHPSVGRNLKVGEAVEVEVSARVWFDFSGILVEKGTRLTFDPMPMPQWKDASIECGPDGWPADTGEEGGFLDRLKLKFFKSGAVSPVRRVPGANWFELVACVRPTERGAVPVGKGQHRLTPWECPTDGPLCFFANDARKLPLLPDFYDNNSGSVKVRVERVG